MEARLKIGVGVAGLVLAFSGCASIDENSPDAQPRAVAPAPQPQAALVPQPQAAPVKPTRIDTPSDVRVAAAMNEALPTIGKVVAIHRCLKDWESLRLLNGYAIPGKDMARLQAIPNDDRLKYHDHNKCVSPTMLDRWTMPALNALVFRTVYFADDSGETVNFAYLFKKSDDGSWKVASFCSNIYSCDLEMRPTLMD